MNTRILSPVVGRVVVLAVGMSAIVANSTPAVGQSGASYYTDPETGIVYRKITRTVERPVVETAVRQQERTVFRPQTVTESRPESRTVYTPVVEYKWEPRLYGRWNPFRQPTVAYHHVPRTHWEPRNEVVHRTNTRTEWVAEKRTVDIPQRIVRIQREQKVDYEPVGRVSPNQAGPRGPSSAIASRLRPLSTNTRIDPLNSQPYGGSQLAANSVGQMTSAPPQRSIGQGGMKAQELNPGLSGYRGQALPPVNGGSGIANLNPLPFFR